MPTFIGVQLKRPGLCEDRVVVASSLATCDSRRIAHSDAKASRMEIPGAKTLRAIAGVIALALPACGCANVPLQQGEALSSYRNLQSADGKITKSKIMIDPAALSAAKSIRIIPTTASAATVATVGKPADLKLVSNAIDRAMCIALSDRFQVVGDDQPADLTVRASIVDIYSTDKVAAGVSTVTSLGTSVVGAGLPRLPIGLGGLDVEAEAVAPDGTQKAAMIWSRGADSFTTPARVSSVGDAYALAWTFGDDFGTMLSKGRSPFEGMGSLPSAQALWAKIGGENKYPACEHFGRAPGLIDAIGSKFGVPPEWTDRQAGAS